MNTSKYICSVLSVAGLLAATSASAQTYVRFEAPAPYVPLTGATTATFISNDDGTDYVPIGFPFTYFGVVFTHINLGTNGAAALANPCTSIVDCSVGGAFALCDTATGGCQSTVPLNPPFPAPTFPSTQGPNSTIGLWWEDMQIPQGGVTYRTIGTAPTREFVAQWENIRIFGASSPPSTANFQLRLNEASGAVRLHYGTFTAGPDASSWSGAMGFEDPTGTIGFLGLPCAQDQQCNSTDLQGLTDRYIEIAALAGVELVAEGTASTGGAVGDPITVDVTARNLGQTDNNTAFFARAYLSVDATVDASDMLLGQVAFPAPLPAQGTLTRTINGTVPNLASGFYTIGVIIDPDNRVTEDIESNNTSVLTSTFLVGADLSVEVDALPQTGPNENVDATVRVLNLGAAQPAVAVAVYLSTDATFDVGDAFAGSSTVAIPAQPSTTVTVPCSIPNLAGGDYFTIAVVDPGDRISEADETNNTATASSETTLTGPDLAADQVAADSEFAFLGRTMRVSAQIRNEGGSVASNFFYSFHLSENQLISAISDPLLGEYGPITVPAGTSISVEHIVTVPADLTPGPHYLGLVVDTTSQVLDGNPNNNIDRQRTPITVRAPGADFTVLDIEVAARAAAGESTRVARTLANRGNAGANLRGDIFLSVDNAFDASDVNLGDVSAGLAAGAESTGVDVLRIPSNTAPGTYFIIYSLDPMNDVDELFEDNNIVVSPDSLQVLASELTIVSTSLPTAIANAQYETALLARGGSGVYTWTLQGNLPDGLSLDANTGFISGTPTTEGPSTFTVVVSDGVLTVSAELTLLVVTPSGELEIVTRSLPPGFINRPYDYPLTANGGVPPYTWSLQGGSTVPTGLTFSPEGRIFGVPEVTADPTLNLRVTDARGDFAERPIILRVVLINDIVRLSDDTFPDGRLLVSYEFRIKVVPNSGVSPFVYEMIGGELPPGMSIENNLVKGTPTLVGDYIFTIRVTDGRGDFDTNRYVLTVVENDGLSFSTTSLPSGKVGEDYTETDGAPVRIRAFSTATSEAISVAIVSGDFPPGLTLTSSGSIQGRPTNEGTFSFLVAASDATGQSDVRAFGIVVAPADEVVIMDVVDDGCTCRAAAKSDAGAWSGLLLLGIGLLWRRRKAWPLLALMMVTSSAEAGAPYQLENINETYVQRSGGTALAFGNNDDGEAIVNLPFAFNFFGGSYQTVRVSTNGYLTFGGDGTEYTNQPIPLGNTPNDLIAYWWDDLFNPQMSVYFDGTAPNRVVVVQMTGGQRLGSAGGGSPKAQVWLYEGGAGRFEVRYGGVENMTQASAWNASAGYENGSGTEGASFFACTNLCDGNILMGAADTGFRVLRDAGPDVRADNVIIPARVFPGIAAPYEVSLSSLHQNALGPFSYALRLRDAAGMGLGEIYRSAPITLSPFETLTETVQASLPSTTAPGIYEIELVVDVDAELVETNETNNRRLAAGSVRVGSRQPDFSARDVSASAMSASPGDTVGVDFVLANEGNLAGTAAWRVVLSPNEVLSVDDPEVASGSVMTTASSTQTISTSFVVPSNLNAGSYRIGVLLDPDEAVEELRELNNDATAPGFFAIRLATIEVITAQLPSAYLNERYSAFFSAAGGDGTYSWSTSGGQLPAGLTLLGTGELRGAPSSTGTSNFTVQVSSAGLTATRDFQMQVQELDAGLVIATRELLPGLVGEAYPPGSTTTPVEMQQRITTIGGAGGIMITAAALPPGLELAPDGYLSGTPLQEGVFDVAITARDNAGNTAQRTLPLTIALPGRFTLVSAILPEGRIAEEYRYLFRVLGAQTGTVAFSADAEELPPGLSLTETGLLVGVPNEVGAYTFAVTAAEGNSDAEDSAVFRIVIGSDNTFDITPSSIVSATLGEEYDAKLQTRGGVDPLIWRVLGPRLQRGFRFEVSEDTRELRFFGTPEVEGTVSFLVIVDDSSGRTAQRAYTMHVKPKDDVVVMPMDDGGCRSTKPSAALLLVFGLLWWRRRRPCV